MDIFRDKFNLVTSEPNAELEESSLLFTVENYFLEIENKKDPSFNEEILKQILVICRENKGIYRQHPAQLTGHDQFMSHDQLTALFCFSYIMGLNHHIEIWDEIKRQLLRYNNINVPTTFKEKLRNKRYLHPRDIIFYGICNKNKIAYTAIPLLIIIMFISCWSKRKVMAYGAPALKTDGKLLTYIRIRALGWKWLNKFFDWIIKIRFGGWSKIFKVYFRREEHPNVVESRGLA
jgi:hypothetical protein